MTDKAQIQLLIDQLQSLVDDLPEHDPVESGVIVHAVTEARAAELSGYSIETLRGRRKSGLYRQNDVWWHDQHGKVIFNFKRLQELMQCHQQKENTPESKSEARQSESGSDGKAKDAGKSTPPPLQLRA